MIFSELVQKEREELGQNTNSSSEFQRDGNRLAGGGTTWLFYGLNKHYQPILAQGGT